MKRPKDLLQIERGERRDHRAPEGCGYNRLVDHYRQPYLTIMTTPARARSEKVLEVMRGAPPSSERLNQAKNASTLQLLFRGRSAEEARAACAETRAGSCAPGLLPHTIWKAHASRSAERVGAPSGGVAARHELEAMDVLERGRPR
jgi:hypothetical protein